MNSGFVSNLLEETLDKIDRIKYKEEDISYVKVPVKDQKDCANISWEDFKEHSKNINYDPGFGIPEISENLKIVFKDGNFMERREYDGSEWWQLVVVPNKEETIEPFNNETMYIRYEREF